MEHVGAVFKLDLRKETRTQLQEEDVIASSCLIQATPMVNCEIKCFYPRDAMLARVFAIATCLSVCLSVCHTPVLWKQDREMYTIW